MGILMMAGMAVSEIFALFVVSGIFFKRKLERSEFFLIFPTFCCCSSFLWLLLPYFGSRYLKTGVCLLILSIVLTLFYKGNMSGKLFVSLIYYIYLYVLDYTVMGMVIIISGQGLEKIRERVPVWIVGSILAKSVLFLVGLLVWRLIYLSKTRKKHSVLYWMQILLIPFCMILNLGLVLFYMNQTEKIRFFLWLDVVALIAGNLLFLFLEQKLEEEWQTRMENQELSRMSEEAAKRTAMMEEAYREQRKMTHDFRNHLLTIQGLLTEEQVHDAQDYLTKLLKEEAVRCEVIHTGSNVLDAILNRAYQEAVRNSIVMEFEGNPIPYAMISQDDMTVLLTNLLDNAIEAAKKTSPEKRVVVRMQQKDKESLISIRNTTIHDDAENMAEMLDGFQRPDTCRHGFGLKNVIRIVKKYRGIYAVQCKDGWFQITIFFR